LPYPLPVDCTLDFIELNSTAGNRVYVRTLFFAFITAMAIKRPEVQIELQNSLGSAIYCHIKNDIVLSKYDLEDVNKTMQKMIAQKTPVELKWLSVEEAKKLVKPNQTQENLPLLDVVEGIDKVPLFKLKSEWAFFLGNMLPDLGYIKGYKLLNYKTGVLICYPSGPDYSVVPELWIRLSWQRFITKQKNMARELNVLPLLELNKYIKDGNSRGIIKSVRLAIKRDCQDC